MYIMYVNFYLQSFLHIQKAVFLFFFVYIYLYIFIDLYIQIFHILPTSICTTIMKKKNIYIYVNPFFLFLYYKCIFIKIYLCTKVFFFFQFINMLSILRDASSSSKLRARLLESSVFVRFPLHVTLLVQSKIWTLYLLSFSLMPFFCLFFSSPPRCFHWEVAVLILLWRCKVMISVWFGGQLRKPTGLV